MCSVGAGTPLSVNRSTTSIGMPELGQSGTNATVDRDPDRHTGWLLACGIGRGELAHETLPRVVVGGAGTEEAPAAMPAPDRFGISVLRNGQAIKSGACTCTAVFIDEAESTTATPTSWPSSVNSIQARWLRLLCADTRKRIRMAEESLVVVLRGAPRLRNTSCFDAYARIGRTVRGSRLPLGQDAEEAAPRSHQGGHPEQVRAARLCNQGAWQAGLREGVRGDRQPPTEEPEHAPRLGCRGSRTRASDPSVATGTRGGLRALRSASFRPGVP